MSRKLSKNINVSIIIPYFRKKKYFKDTIKSILDQTHKNYEIILIYDDHSRVELPFVQKVLKKVKNKNIIINKKNQGVAKSRNIGLYHAKHEFIAFIDADDIWFQKKLEKQLDFMVKKNLDLSFTSYILINENKKKYKTYYSKSRLFYQELLTSCDIGLSSVIVKKQVLDKFKFPDMKTKEDYLMWLMIARKNFKLGGLKTVLMKWRSVDGSLSSNSLQKILDAFKVYYIYLKYNFIKSLFYTFLLSINYLKKRYFK